MTSTLAVDGGSLPDARNQLRDAIAALINPQPVTTAAGGGRFTDCLYNQLRDALPGRKLERTGHPRSTPPMWVDAADLLREVDTTLRGWQPDTGSGGQPVTVLRLRVIEARKWRPQDVPEIRDKTNQLRAWVERINGLLDDDHTRFLYAANTNKLAACPACNATVVHRRDSAGEVVRQPALRIRGDATTMCGACRTTWGPDKALFVARLLGYELPAGVLE